MRRQSRITRLAGSHDERGLDRCAGRARVSDILVDVDLTARLGQLRVPVLYASGRYDECTAEAAADFAAPTPVAEVVVFEQSAHMPMLEEPDAFSDALRQFLGGVESSYETGTKA